MKQSNVKVIIKVKVPLLDGTYKHVRAERTDGNAASGEAVILDRVDNAFRGIRKGSLVTYTNGLAPNSGEPQTPLVRQNKGVLRDRRSTPGEEDLSTHTRVYVPTKRGVDKVWVLVIEGTKYRGVGIIDQALNDGCDGAELGSTIEFRGGTRYNRPRLHKVLKTPNKRQELLDNVAKGMVEAMTFNPTQW